MSTATQAAPAKKKRGTESVRDMVLSLIAVFAVILPFYWLSGLADDEEGGVQAIDPEPQYAALGQAVPGVPVPADLPAQWRATSTDLDGPSLRVTYVTPDEQFAEYAARGGELGTFLADQTGEGRRVTDLAVGDRRFQVWSNDDGATSLVLQQRGWTVVVGGLRETAEDDELTELAASLG